jgi:hypothetical protein
MHWIDWTIILVYIVWIAWDGLRRTRDNLGSHHSRLLRWSWTTA